MSSNYSIKSGIKTLLKELAYHSAFPLVYASYFIIRGITPEKEYKLDNKFVNEFTYNLAKLLCKGYKGYISRIEKDSKGIGSLYRFLKKYNLESILLPYPKECDKL